VSAHAIPGKKHFATFSHESLATENCSPPVFLSANAVFPPQREKMRENATVFWIKYRIIALLVR